MQLRAARIIKKDEELTTQYCELMKPSAQRQESLAPYEVQCSCPSCLNPAVSDPRRVELAHWPDAEYTKKWNSWLRDAKLKEDTMSSLLKEKLKVLEEEGLETTGRYQIILQWIINSYVVIADEKNVIVWGKRLGKWHLAHSGNQREMTRLSTLTIHRANFQWGCGTWGKMECPFECPL